MLLGIVEVAFIEVLVKPIFPWRFSFLVVIVVLFDSGGRVELEVGYGQVQILNEQFAQILILAILGDEFLVLLQHLLGYPPHSRVALFQLPLNEPVMEIGCSGIRSRVVVCLANVVENP